MTQEQLRMQMLAGIITEGQYKAKLNKNKAPLSITVKVTENGKNSMGLYKTPNAIEMTSDQQNPQSESYSYYIGNTEFKLNEEAKVYFATYRYDIEEILISYLAPKDSEEFEKLTTIQYLPSHAVKGEIPYSNCKFEDGFEKGMKDHRNYFEII